MSAMKRYLITAITIFILVSAFSFLRLRLNPFFSYLFAINISSFLLYGIDKLTALYGLKRVPERLLHLTALLGGSPLAILAQYLFHHKTSKANFQFVYWLIVFLQAAVVYIVMYTDMLKYLF
ncbi:MAG: hypothetical protein B5M52_06630 [Helicobacteraceae bacterium 4484_230]|nr:MAG: hypothetical protein B5M52_06630 [Helicobacteraceae bacterium 4484_230]